MSNQPLRKVPTWAQISQQTSGRKFDLFYWADMFLHEYGINYEDFKKLNIQTFWLLRDRMEKRYEEQNKQLEKGKRRKR